MQTGDLATCLENIVRRIDAFRVGTGLLGSSPATERHWQALIIDAKKVQEVVNAAIKMAEVEPAPLTLAFLRMHIDFGN
jgi:hypothetical protein